MLDWKRFFSTRKQAPVVLDQPAEDPVETLREAMRCYVSLLGGIADHAPDTPKQLKEDYGFHLRKIRDEVGGSAPTAKLLRDTDKRAQAQLKGYGKGIEKYIRQHEKDTREVMSLVASMAESVASQEKQNHVRFKGIAKKLRLLTTAGDVAEIRQRLAEEVGQLEKYVEDMTRDTRAALERVNTNLLALRERQNASPWLEREADAVTQLPGRPMGREAIETRMRAGVAFVIARFAITNHAALGERHRPAEVNLAMAEFAVHLREEFQQASSLCRWSEAEYVATFDCHLPEVAGKLSEAEQKLTAAYRGVPVRCLTSAVQPFPGETVDQLMSRLETASLETTAA